MDEAATALVAVVVARRRFHPRLFRVRVFGARGVERVGLLTNPLYFVPVVMFCEFAMTLQWASVGSHVDWRRVQTSRASALLPACQIGSSPIITRIGAGPARVVIAAYVLVMCRTGMLRGWHMKAEAGPGAAWSSRNSRRDWRMRLAWRLARRHVLRRAGHSGGDLQGDVDRRFRAVRWVFCAAHVVARHHQPRHVHNNSAGNSDPGGGRVAGSRHFLAPTRRISVVLP